MRIVIDPGHGGDRPAGRSSPVGAIGPGGLREKDVTLALARRLRARLGGAAELTREADSNRSLAERADVARRAGADVFISLHASGGAGNGPRGYVHVSASDASRRLVATLQRHLARFGGAVGPPRAAELAVLAPSALAPHTAACLIELDDPGDAAGERRLADPARLDAIAAQLADGLRAFGGAGAAPRRPGGLDRQAAGT